LSLYDKLFFGIRPLRRIPIGRIVEGLEPLIDRTISNYIRTYTGRKFWPLNPRPEDICIEDIAHAPVEGLPLRRCTPRALLRRSAQRSRQQHRPPEPALTALLHDASEAYLATCAVRSSRTSPATPTLKIGSCGHRRRVRLPYPFAAEIKVADMRLLVTERRDLMPDGSARTPTARTTEPLWMRSSSRGLRRRPVAFMHFLQRYQERSSTIGSVK
jgi:hypothetical protein